MFTTETELHTMGNTNLAHKLRKEIVCCYETVPRPLSIKFGLTILRFQLMYNLF